ncbi:MAG TPA: class I SAM-dependent methyltransferase [Acidobacteriaceae bacterium]|jgi:hypothetical protein|nr:class I SAM-dependent methyltransferase [Acidobacteriaceae bacterium]
MGTLDSIHALPPTWHANGSLNPEVVDYLFHSAEGALCTAETGCGRSTLALSCASRRHLVFACDVPSGENPETHSLNQVRTSPLLKVGVCEFVIGPTQQTLPAYHFNQEIDLVFLDGPHGYPFPELEYFYFYPHIRAGGFLVIDDIQIPTLAHMVDVLKDDSMFHLEKVVRSTAFFRRTNAPTFPPFGDAWWSQGYNSRRGFAIRNVSLSSRPRVFVQGLLRRMGRYS